jgi:hypothetical protein
VAACKACNHKKGNRTPSEVKMYPQVKAYQPTISEFLRRRVQLLGIDDLIKDMVEWSITPDNLPERL